jgi:phage protein D
MRGRTALKNGGILHMKKDDLIALGISEEQADKIVEMHNGEINGSFIPKHRFDEVNNENKTLKDTIKERDGQLESLKKSEGDVETLKKQIADLQADNKKALEAHKAEMAKLKMDGVIDNVLTAAGAKNVKAIRALFDESGFKLQEDGTVFGLGDALKAVQTSDPYLFKETEPKPQGMTGFKPDGGDQGKAPDINTMTYSQFIAAGGSKTS